MARKKKVTLAVLLVLLALAAAFAAYWLIWHRGSSSKDGAVFVQSVSGLTGSSIVSNRYSGVVENQKTEKVNCDSEKKIAEMLVQEGDRVNQGDPLFTYDTSTVEIDIQSAELEIERLNQTIENSNTQLAQLQKDMEKASTADKPSYSAQILDLQADIAQAQYDIKTKEKEIAGFKATAENATVTAPISGTISSAGDPLNPTATQIGPDGEQEAFITILADGDLRIKGSVNEQNIYDISEGTPVIVYSRIHENETWHGVVSSIDTQAESNNQNYYYSEGERASKYPFYVNLDSVDGLMLGQHVLIEVDYGQGEGRSGLWLSGGFILQEEGGSYVWACKDGGRLEKRAVTLGDYDPDMDEWQIVDGLATSDYLAWPSDDCKAGAPTTTEYVFEEEDFPEDEPMIEDPELEAEPVED